MCAAHQGGSPWGAGTFAGPDGSRQPTEHELGFAKHEVGDWWQMQRQPGVVHVCDGGRSTGAVT